MCYSDQEQVQVTAGHAAEGSPAGAGCEEAVGDARQAAEAVGTRVLWADLAVDDSDGSDGEPRLQEVSGCEGKEFATSRFQAKAKEQASVSVKVKDSALCKVTGMVGHGCAREAFRRVLPEAFRPGGGGEVGARILAFLEGRCSLDELQEFIRGFPRTRFIRDLLRVCEDLSDGGGGGGGRQPEELPVGRGRRRRTRR